MASDKVQMNAKQNWRQSSVRNASSLSSEIDFDGFAPQNGQRKIVVPKFLRSQSSSGILPSPKKANSASRFLGNLIHSGDSFAKGSIRDKNCNYSSLTNLSRSMSPSNRNASLLNHSKSLRSVDHIIDENSEFQPTVEPLNEELAVSSVTVPNRLDLNASSLHSSRLARCRTNHFRRRSISWDCSDNAKAQKRYGN